MKALRPSLKLLRKEYVLVQAWKKTAAYIRRHNWFNDTLELDLTAVDLRKFLHCLSQERKDPGAWSSRPLRLVLAPKSQDWWVRKECEATGSAGAPRWQPRPKDSCCRPEQQESRTCCCPRCGSCWETDPCGGPEDVTDRLRPLAHVALRDQVVATALMLCLANRVESRQGDPRPPRDDAERAAREARPKEKKQSLFMSYGNRLFCDEEAGELRHRWGSTKLYRGFYQDYRQFLTRPRKRAEDAARNANGDRTFIVQTDIRRFYDEVRPEALQAALNKLRRSDDDPAFFELAKRVLCWTWRDSDQSEVERYARKGKIRCLDQVALPQGLVSAGFWSNVALLDFDKNLQTVSEKRSSTSASVTASEQSEQTHPPGLKLAYACRYVDDIRFVVTTTGADYRGGSREEAEKKVAESVRAWAQDILSRRASDLEFNQDKTAAVEFLADRPGQVLLSERLNRIQERVSGGFSASEGLELLEAIQGLLMLRRGFTRESDEGQWEHAPEPDVPEDSRARFGAFRYRKVARDIRAMLPEKDDSGSLEGARARPGTSIMTREDLDSMTRSFALALVEKWVNDPSNVRILLTALDLWPDAEILRSVLDLLLPWIHEDLGLPDAQRVAWYCLSEVFRAGATEAGLHGDSESRPSKLSLEDYRRELMTAAWKTVGPGAPDLPWYLRQQALLLLFASESYSSRLHQVCRQDDPAHYRTLAAILAAAAPRPNPDEFSKHAIVLHRCFRRAVPGARWTAGRMKSLARHDPSFAAELLNARDGRLDGEWKRLAERLLVKIEGLPPNSLARLVKKGKIERDEPTLLRLALLLIDGLKDLKEKQKERDPTGPVPPWEVRLKHQEQEARPETESFPWTSVCLDAPAEGENVDPWRVPEFCQVEDHWRYQLGYLLRFALSRSPDFTSNVDRSRAPAAPRYRSAGSSWVQRKYGGYHDQRALGGDWLPISDWFERFLSALLWWPGRRKDEHTREIDRGIRAARAWIEKRKQLLEAAVGKATEVQCLPMAFSSSYLPEGLTRLRGCIVQTIYPAEPDFDGDLTLSSEHSRSRHREHLTNALALVRQGLRARRGGSSADGPLLDLLVLPELSVHPDDVRRYLLPFAQAFKTIILAGVVYEELPPETAHLVNTVTWVIPEHSAANGWNVRVRRQGKEHPAKPERDLREMGKPVRGYRPCQWIIECPSPIGQKPLRLGASVCYDATDLTIASDLRERSDVFLIPALNKDVHTFDALAIGLSYQMYQLVVVANNGKYGGSSAYWPIGKAHERRIMHLRGGNQPTLGFFEITDVPAYRRGREEESRKPYEWKEPPAGYSAKHSNKR